MVYDRDYQSVRHLTHAKKLFQPSEGLSVLVRIIAQARYFFLDCRIYRLTWTRVLNHLVSTFEYAVVIQPEKLAHLNLRCLPDLGLNH